MMAVYIDHPESHPPKEGLKHYTTPRLPNWAIHPESHPPKEGLKPTGIISYSRIIFHPESHPPKEGLKRCVIATTLAFFIPSRITSTKRRIET